MLVLISLFLECISQRPIADILRGTSVWFMCSVAHHMIEVQVGAVAKQINYDNLIYALGNTVDQDAVPVLIPHNFNEKRHSMSTFLVARAGLAQSVRPSGYES